ncbi:conserved membrane hypothetical protein [Rubrivivax sp. A210]|uniref:hypothetical protein n=1 Tax=Rubrivivax sp. A210 TaxID=2772301 RepID=UPI00191A65FD|nr:hypothetical protein [Rubrivivax sp. A210]CAD5373719.1 conserved membrane hypothetical protein [Rubrivivax sp. A210]
MAMTQPDGAAQPPEQLRYARWLEAGARAGLVLLVASFAALATGLLPPQVALQRLPELWGLPVADYLRQTHATAGWGWLRDLAHGDSAGLAGIALLAGCSLAALLAVLPLYLRRGERLYAALCLAQVALIALAASGWLASLAG